MEVSLRKDIVQSVAKELGMTEEKINSVFSFFLWRMKDLVRRPDVVSIFLYKLGTFYVKVPLLEKEINFSKILMKGVEKARYKQMVLCNNSALEAFNMHLKKTKISNSWYTMGMNIEQLEEFQNKIADGRN